MSSQTINISVPSHGTPSCMLSICWSADFIDKSLVFRSKLIAELDGISIKDVDSEVECVWHLVSNPSLLEVEPTSVTFVCTTVFAAVYIKQMMQKYMTTLLELIEERSLVRDVKHMCNKFIGGGVFGGGSSSDVSSKFTRGLVTN